MNARFVSRIFLITGGLLIWAALFLFTYILVALACARGFFHAVWLGIDALPLVLAGATVISLAGLAQLVRRAEQIERSADYARRADDDDLVTADVTCMVCLLALVAIIWNSLPTLLIGIRC